MKISAKEKTNCPNFNLENDLGEHDVQSQTNLQTLKSLDSYKAEIGNHLLHGYIKTRQ